MSIHTSNLQAENDVLELVDSKTSIPVPQVYNYYKSAEFEHFVIERLPVVALEEAWPGLNTCQGERIADEVVRLLREIRMLHSLDIKSSLPSLEVPSTWYCQCGGLQSREVQSIFFYNKHVSI